MNLQEILSLNLERKQVLLIGLPASGKSWLAEKLYYKMKDDKIYLTHVIVDTDKFRDAGMEESLYNLIGVLSTFGDQHPPRLVVGCLGYRLLRKSFDPQYEGLAWKPNVVIECVVPEWKQDLIYRTERPNKDIKAVKSFNKGLQNIYNQWLFETPEGNKPEIYTFNNDF